LPVFDADADADADAVPLGERDETLASYVTCPTSMAVNRRCTLDTESFGVIRT
jgi:hypothetical protein